MDFLTEEEVSEFRDAFRLLDKEGDGGCITMEEMIAIMKSIGRSSPNIEYTDIINHSDFDFRGNFDLRELFNLTTDIVETVPKGTNGGITLDGLLAATLAGIVIGIPFILVGLITAECSANVSWRQLLVVPVAAFAGLFGSLVDSFIGATLQFSGYCTVRKKVVAKPGPTVVKISGMNILDNNSVNMVSVLLTSLLTSITCIYIF